MSKLEQVFEGVRDSIAVKRVYGEPYEKNGVTVIPAATVMGGAGGGEGTVTTEAPAEGNEAGKPTGPGGFGGGFGISGRPAGAFVVKGDDVRWLPAVDVNRLMFGFQLVLIVFFLVMRSMAKTRAKSRLELAKAANAANAAR